MRGEQKSLQRDIGIFKLKGKKSTLPKTWKDYEAPRPKNLLHINLPYQKVDWGAKTKRKKKRKKILLCNETKKV